jgi:hypothetical protein
MKKINIVLIFITFFLLNSCATYDVKYSGEKLNKKSVSDKKIEKTFFLIGDAGLTNIGETSDALKALKKHTGSLNTEGDYTIFLGDNIYPILGPYRNIA